MGHIELYSTPREVRERVGRERGGRGIRRVNVTAPQMHTAGARGRIMEEEFSHGWGGVESGKKEGEGALGKEPYVARPIDEVIQFGHGIVCGASSVGRDDTNSNDGRGVRQLRCGACCERKRQ